MRGENHQQEDQEGEENRTEHVWTPLASSEVSQGGCTAGRNRDRGSRGSLPGTRSPEDRGNRVSRKNGGG